MPAFLIAFLAAPIISVWSDRLRGARGRRIPFLIWSTPFVGLFMLLLGCVDLFKGSAQGFQLAGIGQTTATALLFIVLFIAFDFANVFSGTVFYYLFNDVVPEHVFGRFLAVFRMAGTGGGILFSAYIFPDSLKYFGFIFIAAGLIFVAGFLLMCFMVKEQPYPPPPPNMFPKAGPIGLVPTFFAECFGHKFYWFFYLQSMFLFLSWQSGAFAVLRNRNSLGVSLAELGQLGAWTGLISLALCFPAGWIADWLHPMRVYVFTMIASLAANLAQCVFIVTDFGPKGNQTFLMAISLAMLPFGALNAAAELPMYMRLLPRSRYGQFCSANAMVRSVAMIFGSWAFVALMEFADRTLRLGDWRYRLYPIWTVAFQGLALVFLFLLYTEWRRRGGAKGYTPPDPQDWGNKYPADVYLDSPAAP